MAAGGAALALAIQPAPFRRQTGECNGLPSPDAYRSHTCVGRIPRTLGNFAYLIAMPTYARSPPLSVVQRAGVQDFVRDRHRGDFKQLEAATAKGPSQVASLVAVFLDFSKFPSRHCRTYRTLLVPRSRTLRYQSGGALRALAMYRKSTGHRDRGCYHFFATQCISLPEVE
jgi:hypothetical protein